MVVLRRPTLEDAPAIARVHALSWQSAYRGIVPDEFLDAIDVDVWAERHRRNMAEDPEDFIPLVAELEGDIVGWALGGPNREPSLDFSGELLTLYLLPGHQRRGIGSRLFSAVAGSFVELGWNSMLLWVLAENQPARRFYEALGGEYVAERELSIGGTPLMEVAYGWRDMSGFSVGKA